MTSWKLLFVTTYISVLTSGIVKAATADEWKSRSIYQVVTDRFARSDDASAPCDTSQRVYCGGTWKGITNHLDYIQGLGFDAVWISPIVKNIEATTPYGEAYHGYWTQDLNGLNTQFGSQDDLKELSSSLHSRGMFLMLDVVVNHFATLNATNSGETDYTSISPFNSATQFHPKCLITDYNNQTDVEQCWLGDDTFPLPDLNTEDSAIVQTMNNWIKNMVQTYNADGLRIDTVKHIRKDFWPDFVKSAGVFSIGEVNLGFFVLDGVLDYPSYFTLIKAFNSPSGNLSALVDIVKSSQTSYKDGLFPTGSFLENHDQPRFQNITTDQALVRNAVAWTFAQDGIPIVYYGQEQGFQGAQDPLNREALWPTGFATADKPLVNHIKALNTARKLAISRNNDFLSTRATFIPQSNPSIIAISKSPLLTLLTNVGSNANSTTTTWNIPSSSKLYQGNEALVDVLTCSTFSANSNGDLVVQVDAGSPKVLMRTTDLSKGGSLCPNLAVNNKNDAGGRQVKGGMPLMAGVVLATALYLVMSPIVL
ncbi:Alpha-amylase 1 [Leucoagaricus sp. SymC.cos]|nr:Alpha-amylase 1 [Leucoagaricus sp. SymC.cos]